MGRRRAVRDYSEAELERVVARLAVLQAGGVLSPDDRRERDYLRAIVQRVKYRRQLRPDDRRKDWRWAPVEAKASAQGGRVETYSVADLELFAD